MLQLTTTCTFNTRLPSWGLLKYRQPAHRHAHFLPRIHMLTPKSQNKSLQIKQGESHIPPSDTATWHNHLQNLRWRTTSLFRTLLFSVGLYLQPSNTIDRACLVYYKWWKHKIIPLTSNLGQLQKYAFFRFIYSEEKKPDFLRLTWLHPNSCCPAWSIWIWGNIFFVWKVKITVVWALLGCGKN